MNAFEQAIRVHEQWKKEFESAVREGTGEFDVDLIRLDDRCLLGRWLHASGSQAIRNPTAFQMLCDVHAEFHEAAADVLALALAGRAREAISAMGEGAQYQSWSSMLLLALKGYADAGPGEATGSTMPEVLADA